jgi:heme d1 biosynthesis radical SAM protein NirJ
MFRISQYLGELARAEREGRYPLPSREGNGNGNATPPGPVVIWNLIRRCNLSCKHCYALSADHAYEGELGTADVFTVMDDLRAFGVQVLILSGGEPLMRPDLFEIAERARSLGFYVGLATNGTLIDEAMADRVARAGFDYVGISLDGIAATHDRFRRLDGAFDLSLAAMRRLHARSVKLGLRYTMTAMNAQDLPALLQLMRDEGIDKFYFSHLNYAGRGNIHRAQDARFAATREALDLLFARAWDAARAQRPEQYVSGNNDADGPWLLQWLARHEPSLHARFGAALRARLVAWGGNASGVGVANIDNLGEVHPDTMWWHHALGNVRQRPFSAIWRDVSDPLMAGLKQRPRPVGGRCAACRHLDICGGNTRVRAEQITGNAWAEDPGCYLDDDEIGLGATRPATRVLVTPFAGKRRVPIVVAGGRE